MGSEMCIRDSNSGLAVVSANTAFGCNGQQVFSTEVLMTIASDGTTSPPGVVNSPLLVNAGCDAALAASADANGLTDWYLPSTLELLALRGLGLLPVSGGFWSSTEDSDDNAFLVFNDNGNPSTSGKASVADVIQVRSF